MSTKVKGAVLVARGAYVRASAGEEGWQRVLAGTPPEARKVLAGSLLSSKWYPFEINEALDEAIVEVLGRGRREIFKEIGAWSARQNLSGPHKWFLAPGDPGAFLARTGAIYSFYYDTGYREYEARTPNSGVMTTYEAETFSDTDCLTVIGWYEEALAMCGAREVAISETSCRAQGAEFCRYQLRWR